MQRGGRITHQILRYSHASNPVLQSIDVSRWLASSADELRSLLGARIELRIDVPQELRMTADPHQLQQIFSNLATNAADAIQGNGVFSIEARYAESWLGLPPHDDGFVHFLIEDDGPAIDSELGSHIFEPLFTTKPSGTDSAWPSFTRW